MSAEQRPQAKPDKVLKLGALYAQSGPVSSWGISAVRGMQIIVDYYNQKGGITVGGQKYKLELVIYDDKAMGSEGGVLGAQSLINEHKVPYIQCFWGDVTKAIRPITNEAKVITFHTGRSPVVEPKWPYLFHTNTSAIQEAEAFYPVVYKNNPSARSQAFRQSARRHRARNTAPRGRQAEQQTGQAAVRISTNCASSSCRIAARSRGARHFARKRSGARQERLRNHIQARRENEFVLIQASESAITMSTKIVRSHATDDNS